LAVQYITAYSCFWRSISHFLQGTHGTALPLWYFVWENKRNNSCTPWVKYDSFHLLLHEEQLPVEPICSIRGRKNPLNLFRPTCNKIRRPGCRSAWACHLVCTTSFVLCHPNDLLSNRSISLVWLGVSGAYSLAVRSFTGESLVQPLMNCSPREMEAHCALRNFRLGDTWPEAWTS
jgi:hypothetical protein